MTTPPWLIHATAPATRLQAVRVMLVVGPILTVINQGDALLGSAEVNWLKVALTFLVPYCVSTYATVKTLLRTHGHGRAA